MKTLPSLCVLLLLVWSPVSNASQSADARMHCWSLRFQRATAVDGTGFQWRLDLTTLGSGVNGELALDFFASGYTHSSYVDLYDEWDNATYPGAMALDVPVPNDANGNGFPDFFEVSQAVDGQPGFGVLDCDPHFYGVSIRATWYRDAGASVGYCRVEVPDPWSSFGNLIFVHSFELIEYNGAVSYTPGSNRVDGTLSLTRTDSTGALDGPVVFEKSPTDPYNELTLQSAFLTNDTLEVLSLYTNTLFFREAVFPSNYFGTVVLQDGDPATVEDDYYAWQLSIDDLNDTDGDDIPDFSDDPVITPPTAPTLTVALGVSNVWISISGEVGRLLEIEKAGTPLATNWTTVRSVTLTNDPQTESLPRPVDTTFWRAWVPAGP